MTSFLFTNLIPNTFLGGINAWRYVCPDHYPSTYFKSISFSIELDDLNFVHWSCSISGSEIILSRSCIKHIESLFFVDHDDIFDRYHWYVRESRIFCISFLVLANEYKYPKHRWVYKDRLVNSEIAVWSNYLIRKYMSRIEFCITITKTIKTDLTN